MTPHEWTAVAVFLNSICLCWWAWRMHRLEQRIVDHAQCLMELYADHGIHYTDNKTRGINGSSSKN